MARETAIWRMRGLAVVGISEAISGFQVVPKGRGRVGDCG